MRLTIRHVYDFGAYRDLVGPDLVRPESWDAIRETPGPFEVASTRAAWEQRARRPDLAERARAIVAVAERVGARRVCSYGVGTADLELNVALVAPELELTCTDFAPRTVERLAALFPEATVRRHDLVTDEPLPADFHLLHRVDAELSAEQWRRAFPRFREPILVVPAMLLDWLTILKELLRRLLKRGATRAGYFRTEDALRDLWAPSHEDERVLVAGEPAFLLTPRR